MEFRAIVLAAGESKRMGAQKLLMPFRGRPLIEYALDAAQPWNPLVVASAAVADYLEERAAIEVLRNDAPERGMTHSLALANARVASDAWLIVLLADKPLVTPHIVETIRAASAGSDVTFPRHTKTHEPGHPVIFSPHARERIALLANGDSLRLLRDDPRLQRREVAMDDRGAYFDIDTAGALSE